MNGPSRILGALSALLLTAALASSPAELYGRPLRGLTPVSLADVAGSPARFLGREIRISGKAKPLPAGTLAVADGEVSVELDTRSFSLPKIAAGVTLTAEGWVRVEEKQRSVRFIAAGVEVTR